MAESSNVYVKIGAERGTYIERTAVREIDHANLRALGFVPKGSKDAPKPADATFEPEPVVVAEQPTSVRAAAEAADPEEAAISSAPRKAAKAASA